jgi:hypothetical protein
MPWAALHDEGVDLTINPGDPFVDEPMPLTKFFEGCAIYYRGIEISRADVVRHIAISRDGVHYGRDQIRDQKISSALDALASGLIDGRDSVFYAYFSIAQTLVCAPDIDVFLEAAKRYIRLSSP